MRILWQDLKFALRMLAKNIGFTVVTVLTLALGIGANAAIFSILDPLLLRSLPVNNPGELVLVHAAGTKESIDVSEASAYSLYREKNTVFSGVIADAGETEIQIVRNGNTDLVHGEVVSGNFFTVLGVRPFVGRLLTADDDRSASGSAVVVLSFDYWTRVFGGDASAVGKTLPIHNLAYTIVGVTPPDFFGLVVGSSPDFYYPLGDHPNRSSWVKIIARLKPDVTLRRAQAGLEPVFQQMLAQSSVPIVERNASMARLVLTPGNRGVSDLRSRFSLPARILMSVVGLILLISCSNVANLLFARGVSRKKEITVRMALGADRWRLMRQLITESTLLAMIGAIVGLLGASWASNLLVASLSTEHFHVVLRSAFNGRVLLFATGVLILTVLLCGVIPAIIATRGDLSQYLKARGAGADGRATRFGDVPVVAQVALAVTVLTVAGLLMHSLVNLESMDVGFNRDNVVAVSLSGRAAGRTSEQAMNFYEELVKRAEGLPGVHCASFSNYTQTSSEMGINVNVEGNAPIRSEDSHVFFNFVTAKYFETMEIPLIAGREFTRFDNSTSPYVVVINRTMAQHYFGDQSPLGRHLNFVAGTKWPTMEIVGVAADSKYNDLREQTPDFVYANRAQMQAFHPSGNIGGVLDVRTDGNTQSLRRSLRNTIQLIDSSVKIVSIKTVREQIDESLHQDRLVAELCTVFSLLALTLTCIGLYGTISFRVARRTSEIGIRMALGAHPRDILRLVIGQGMWMVIEGILLGAVGALGSTSLLTTLLFQVKRADPLTFGGVSFLLVLAGALACYIPARRAMRVHPVIALRYE